MNKNFLSSDFHKGKIGKLGEKKAVDYLRKKFNIIATNYRTKVGEIDIIAKKGETIIFIEVKSRTSDLKGKPYEAVTSSKIKHLQRAINYYLSQNKLYPSSWRIDVVSIEFASNLTVKKLQHFENIEI